ncbi:hypothetical protein E2C01_040039 [Portunus trituberculatus]|uniref:Uncharacterized protein n=1 Tax=Portunus trituberculatus TaxID=210409 RepID=A0A5B7FMI3_PORTR|nr:hypothetical protein [Portunus trituberculatus]
MLNFPGGEARHEAVTVGSARRHCRDIAASATLGTWRRDGGLATTPGREKQGAATPYPYRPPPALSCLTWWPQWRQNLPLTATATGLPCFLRDVEESRV